MTMKYAEMGASLVVAAGSTITVMLPGPVALSRGAGGLRGLAISVHVLSTAAGPYVGPVPVAAATWAWYSV